MLEFGKLEIVEKTFTRTEGAVRTQAYNGIKFRRYESTKGQAAAKEAGEQWTPFMEEQFVISKKAFGELNLIENALTEAKIADKVFLLVLEDQDDKNPPAKFCRQSKTKDGKLSKKGTLFSNEFLTEHLVEVGVLDKVKTGNQYLSLTNVTSEVTGLPAHVKAVYLIAPDTTVDASSDTEEEEIAVANDTSKF